MSPEDARRAAELFEQALDLPPEERGAFLARACNDDAVRREVESLLAADLAESGLTEPAWGASAAPAAPGGPDRVGPYRLVRKLGEGGMSEVFLGVRDDGEIERRVAVKLVRRELLTPETMRRFETERQILASLDHPAIARLHDAGRTADGVPYFIMEYIEGEPIDLYCDRHRLTVAERVELVRQVCFAVHLAHQNLVVHRDIKSSNILVTEHGQPKLLDFGIAKLLNPDFAARRGEPTVAWQRLLTPEYASPEQLLGKPITTASDIYSLGVLLYKLLAGAFPCQLDDRPPAPTGSPPAASEPASLAGEPEAPSAAVRRLARSTSGSGRSGAAVAALRGSRPEDLVRALSGDLDGIVLKALRQEPQNRYASAEQLAEELWRYLAGQPAAAGSARPWDDRRRRRSTAWTAAALLALALAAGALAVQSARLAGARERARQAQAEERAVAAALERLLDDAAPAGEEGGAAARRFLERAARRLHRELAGHPRARAEIDMALGRVAHRLGLPDRAAAAFQAALATRRRLFGERHEEVAESLSALARIESGQRDYEAAVALHRQALAMRRELGHELGVAESLRDLGRIYLIRDHAAEAEAARLTSNGRGRCRPALARRRELGLVVGVGVSRGDRGRISRSRDHAAEAAAALREALILRERLLGDGDPLVAEAQTDLAWAVDELGSPSAAGRLLRESIKVQRRNLEPDSLELADELASLAAVQIQLGKRDAAEESLDRVADAARRHCGRPPAGPGSGPGPALRSGHAAAGDATGPLRALAAAALLARHAARGEPAGAATCRLPPFDEPSLSFLIQGLGIGLVELGDADAAEPLLRELADSDVRRFPAEWAVLWLARARLAQGRFGEAEESLAGLTPFLAGQRPAGDGRVAWAHRSLAELDEARGEAGRAALENRPAAAAARPAAGPAAGCVPDGGFAATLERPGCCSGVVAGGTTACRSPDDWGSTWLTCRHVCGSRLVDGCVPPGGITDTLALTDCCSGRAVTGSTRCLEPADEGTTWRTCVHVCA